MPVEQVTLSADHEALLELLRTRGLSVKGMDERKKEEFRRFLDYLCNERGMSLNDVAKLIGNKTSGYSSWLCRQLGVTVRPFEEARLKGIKEKRRKYERRPFDGSDEDKAYMLGLRHGDLTVYRPWNEAVRLSTSSTHPAMVQLFRTQFEPYGHVYQHPRYKKDTKTYEWNLCVILDDSFSFLLQEFAQVRDWLTASESRVLAYLSGFLDAEGSILVTRNSRGGIVTFVDFFNEDRLILEWIQDQAKKMGMGCSIRMNKPIGRGKTGFHLNHNKEYWQLSIFSAHGIIGFIRQLEPRHPEKVQRRLIALQTVGMSKYDEVVGTILRLRTNIKEDVAQFVRLAETTYLKTHSRPAG